MTPSGIFTSARLVQEEKQFSGMALSLECSPPRSAYFSCEQLTKTLTPMLLMESGSVTLSRARQPAKAESPMLVIVSGKLTEVMFVSPMKAFSSTAANTRLSLPVSA